MPPWGFGLTSLVHDPKFDPAGLVRDGFFIRRAAPRGYILVIPRSAPLAFVTLLAFALGGTAVARPGQDTYYLPDIHDAFHPYVKVPMRLGNGFLARGGDTLITVKLIGNDALDSGTLWYMDPVSGTERFVFSNKDSSRFGEEVVLGQAPRGAPIVFKYVNTRDRRARFTGLNLGGSYDFAGDPALTALALQGRPMPVSSQTNAFGDRRWAVAGRADRASVLFGFEDLVSAPHDFNDIVFLLEGVQLDSEIKLPAPIISETFRDTRMAQVTLTMPTTSRSDDLRIFYTLDGSLPVYDDNGPLGPSTMVYAGPITLRGDATVLAQAWRPSVEDSTVGVTRYLSSDLVEAQIRFAVKALSGVYFDANGDGRIDGARLSLLKPPASLPGALLLEDPFRPETELELTAADLSLEGSGGDVLVARFPDRAFAFGTGFPTREYATAPAGGLELAAGSYAMEDSVGPVLTAATATPPLNGGPARMEVQFSEPVRVDTAVPAFPFALKRAYGADPNGKVQVASVHCPDARTCLYQFAPGSAYHPVPGDSLRLLDHASVSDAGGLRSAMSFHVAISGAPALRRGDIAAQGGDFTVGSVIADPRPLRLPVSLVAMDPAGGLGGPGGMTCLDCRTGEWKVADAARPAEFPNAPRIAIRTRGPFAFDITFFSHLGVRVNRAQGSVSAAMLAGLPMDAEGFKTVGLMWYPVSDRGQPVGTGVYIAEGLYRSLSAPGLGRQGEKVDLSPVVTRVGLRFGYVRK